MKKPGFLEGVAGRALIVTLTRFANQGLIILSPILLVHLLTVEEFGRYREFLLYAGILISIGAFGINNSLLYFIPLRPSQTRQFVRQAMLLTLANSILVVAGTLLLNTIFNGAVVGEYAWPLAGYVLFFVNFDFWEYLLLAERRSKAVFAYTSGRLFLRMLVVVTVAALSRDVGTIIAALIVFEALRFTAALLVWLKYNRGAGAHFAREAAWGEQVRFCLPVGASLLLVVGNKSLGGVFVAKLLGPVALAHYAIGTYVQPIVTVLRNSISDVLLPEMVGRSPGTGSDIETDKLALWRRATVVFAMLLIPVGIVLARYAEEIVVTVFSQRYRAAVPLFQIYLLVLLRECFDFGVPLRAIGKTTPIVHSNLIAVALNLGLMVLLVPRLGLSGAVVAFVVSRFVEGLYLGGKMMALYGLQIRDLAAWGDLAKVLIAAGLACAVVWNSYWTELLGPAGMLLAGAVYVVVFAVLLRLLRLREALRLFARLGWPAGLRTSTP